MRTRHGMSPTSVGTLLRDFAGAMAFIALLFAICAPLLLVP
jgi:hypothetical protein